MTAREELLREMTHGHLYMTDERANELIDAVLLEALRDPRNHEHLMDILRRDARIHPSWLQERFRFEERRTGRWRGQ